jgi:hypothetical protein
LRAEAVVAATAIAAATTGRRPTRHILQYPERMPHFV